MTREVEFINRLFTIVDKNDLKRLKTGTGFKVELPDIYKYTYHYSALFDTIGLDNSKKDIVWSLGNIPECYLKEYNDFEAFGIYHNPDSILLVSEVEISDSNLHRYYTWSDYLFFKEDGHHKRADTLLQYISDDTRDPTVCELDELLQGVTNFSKLNIILECRCPTVELYKQIYREYRTPK